MAGYQRKWDHYGWIMRSVGVKRIRRSLNLCSLMENLSTCVLALGITLLEQDVTIHKGCFNQEMKESQIPFHAFVWVWFVARDLIKMIYTIHVFILVFHTVRPLYCSELFMFTFYSLLNTLIVVYSRNQGDAFWVRLRDSQHFFMPSKYWGIPFFSFFLFIFSMILKIFPVVNN